MDAGATLPEAAVVANLLSNLTGPTATAVEGTVKQPGVYVGDGLPPVPAKLAARIRRWEFVEMHELLPEFWADPRGETSGNTSRGKGKKRAQDIQVWLQCFAQYVSVLSSIHPTAVPELMAYMVGVLRASIEFEEGAWAAYDSAYRRQAAATGHRQWSRVNPSLYTLCFTGKARKEDRCVLCLGSSHRTDDCALATEDDPCMGRRLRAVESTVV